MEVIWKLHSEGQLRCTHHHTIASLVIRENKTEISIAEEIKHKKLAKKIIWILCLDFKFNLMKKILNFVLAFEKGYIENSFQPGLFTLWKT